LVNSNGIIGRSSYLEKVDPKARIRLQIEIEFGLEFDQSKERKPIWSLVNVALIG